MVQPSRRTVLAGALPAGLAGTVATGTQESDPADRAPAVVVASESVEEPGGCTLPRRVGASLGVETGQQVRLRSEAGPATYTVEAVEYSYGAVSDAGLERLGVDGPGGIVAVERQVVDEGMDRETAREEGGLIERDQDGRRTDLVALAPHGGHVEAGTARQALRVAETLECPAWYASGWWPEGGAWRRWHVPSTDLHPASFPRLGALQDREFDAAVSFHGWSESHVAVGGLAPEERRAAVRDEIAAAVGGAVEVRLATDEHRSGTSPDNVVNWLTVSGADGVQVEQPMEARTEHGEAIADAVARALE